MRSTYLIAFLLLTATSLTIANDSINQNSAVAESSNHQIQHVIQPLSGNNIAVSRTKNNNLFVDFYSGSKKIFELDLGDRLSTVEFIQLAHDQKIYLVGKKGNSNERYIVSVHKGIFQEPQSLNLQSVQDVQVSPDGKLFLLGDNQKIVTVEGKMFSFGISGDKQKIVTVEKDMISPGIHYDLISLKSIKANPDKKLYVLENNAQNQEGQNLQDVQDIRVAVDGKLLFLGDNQAILATEVDISLSGKSGDNQKIVAVEKNIISPAMSYDLSSIKSMKVAADGQLYVLGKNAQNQDKIVIVNDNKVQELTDFGFKTIDKLLLGLDGLLYIKADRSIWVLRDGQVSPIASPNFTKFIDIILDQEGRLYGWGKDQSNQGMVSTIINGVGVNLLPMKLPSHIKLTRIEQIVSNQEGLLYLRGYREIMGGEMPVLMQMKINDIALNEGAKALGFFGGVQDSNNITLSQDGALYILEQNKINHGRTDVSMTKLGKNKKLDRLGLVYVNDIRVDGETLYISGFDQQRLPKIISYTNGAIGKIDGTILLKVGEAVSPLKNALNGIDNLASKGDQQNPANGILLWHYLQFIKNTPTKFITVEERRLFQEFFDKTIDGVANRKFIAEDVVNFLCEIATLKINNPAYKEVDKTIATSSSKVETVVTASEDKKSPEVQLISFSDAAEKAIPQDGFIEGKVPTEENLEPKTIPHPLAPYAAAILFKRYDFLNPEGENPIFFQVERFKPLTPTKERKDITQKELRELMKLKKEKGISPEVTEEERKAVRKKSIHLYRKKLADTQYALELATIINQSEDPSLRAEFSEFPRLIKTALLDLLRPIAKETGASTESTNAVSSPSAVDSLSSIGSVESIISAASSDSTGSLESVDSLGSTGDTASTNSSVLEDSFEIEDSPSSSASIDLKGL